jgi:capsule polysaccharide export protein KpsE/RkpR
MLRSRTVLDRMIDRFDLMVEYGKKHRVDARTSLLGVVTTEVDKKSGLVTVGVMDRDPVKAALMANAFVEELQALNRELAVTDASQRRLFLEDQLKDAKDSLVAAEESIRSFQERTGAIKIDEQASAVLTGIADLRAKIAAKEVELRVMRTYATPQNPMLRKTEEGIKGLKEQMAKLESEGTGHNPDPLVPTNRIPSLGTEYLRELREFKYREALYDILLKQYEMARLEEARDPVVIQVIDKAVPPEVRVMPKRRHMVKVAAATALFFSVLLAFLLEYVRRLRLSAEGEKLNSLRSHLLFWK